MSPTIPPFVPPVVPPTSAHEPPQARVHFRVQQVGLSILTVGVTCWLWRIHPVLGIAAAFLAKHILVAILASGLTYPDRPEPNGSQ